MLKNPELNVTNLDDWTKVADIELVTDVQITDPQLTNRGTTHILKDESSKGKNFLCSVATIN